MPPMDSHWKADRSRRRRRNARRRREDRCCICSTTVSHWCSLQLVGFCDESDACDDPMEVCVICFAELKPLLQCGWLSELQC